MKNESYKTKLQIAQELGISARTLHRWIKESGFKTTGKLLSPEEQKELLVIFEKNSFNLEKKNKPK